MICGWFLLSVECLVCFVAGVVVYRGNAMGNKGGQTFQDLMAAHGLSRVKKSGKTKLSVDPVTTSCENAASVPLKAQGKRADPPPVRRSFRLRPGEVFEAIPGGSRPVLAVPELATGYREGGEYFCVHGLQVKIWKKIKRNAFPHAEPLDLHGCTRSKALRKLDDYIKTCKERQKRYAMIVHGKGIHSQSGAAVLRLVTFHFLAENLEVQAFCPAVIEKGGTGATYVRIKL